MGHYKAMLAQSLLLYEPTINSYIQVVAMNTTGWGYSRGVSSGRELTTDRRRESTKRIPHQCSPLQHPRTTSGSVTQSKRTSYWYYSNVPPRRRLFTLISSTIVRNKSPLLPSEKWRNELACFFNEPALPLRSISKQGKYRRNNVT